MGNKSKKVYKKAIVTAKLVLYDWGWRENIIYSLKAKQTEKEKGLMMVERLKDLFNINTYDINKFRRKTLRAFQPKRIGFPRVKQREVQPFFSHRREPREPIEES